jgi:hypothetical protein
MLGDKFDFISFALKNLPTSLQNLILNPVNCDIVLSVRLKVYGNIDSNSFLLQEKQLNTN